MLVSVGGIVRFRPSFGTHWPLKVVVCCPVVLPLICGTATLTVYVPSELTPTLTFASRPEALPDVSVREVEVPVITCQVLPRSHEFFSLATTVSFEVKEWLTVARP